MKYLCVDMIENNSCYYHKEGVCKHSKPHKPIKYNKNRKTKYRWTCVHTGRHCACVSIPLEFLMREIIKEEEKK